MGKELITKEGADTSNQAAAPEVSEAPKKVLVPVMISDGVYSYEGVEPTEQ